MNHLIRDIYIFILERNKPSLKKISKESLQVFMSAMMDGVSLSKCFTDQEYVEKALNKYRHYDRIAKDPRPSFRSK